MTITNPPPKPDHPHLLRLIGQEIKQAMNRDQHPFRQRLKSIKSALKKGGKQAESNLQRLKKDLSASIQQRTFRADNLPKPHFPLVLPVVEQKEKVARLIAENQVIVLCGETGSGKTTQLPKICLQLGRGVAGFIGMTQPRRIAARSIAQFILSDLQSAGSHSGSAVGFKMRFADQVQESTYVKVMTDGILLAEIQSDRYLNQYDTLIIDEAHERSLNIDFLLGYLKRLLPRRPDLKLIISSATLDTEKFSRHFDNAPIIEISGRTYPVEVRYRSLEIKPTGNDPEQMVSDRREKELEEGVVDAIHELFSQEDRGDVLVFLPGEREIREAAEALNKQNLPGTDILPLFARLSTSDQDKIFNPGGRRRIVLATNVAETSITVPGIRYVVDSGLARISRQGGRGQVRRLPIEKIAQSSANQRKGRCGRLSDGICIRLYTQEEFEERPLFSDPEILRTSLDSALLQMKAQGLGEMDAFPFVDPPPPTAIRDSIRGLEELGAIDAQGGLTTIGRQLARLPLDPQIARMILAAKKHGCLREVLVLAAALSVPDPRETPREKREQANQRHQRHQSKESDFVGFLNLWNFIEKGRQTAPSKSQFRKFLKENFLSYPRTREWWEIHHQLTRQVKKMDLPLNQQEATYTQIHKAILAGLLGQIGFKSEKHEFTGTRQIRFFINPGSALFKKPPLWIMTAELVETTRLFARICARLEPEWIEEVAGPLCKRHYSEAHWEKKPGRVMAFEKSVLFGLTLITRRKVHFGPVDPVESRRLFIQSALVEGHFQTNAPFFSYNQALVAEIRELEHKSRRRDLLVDEKTLFNYYDQILPESCYTAAHFHHWYQGARKAQPRLLYFEKEALMQHEGESITGERFPGHLLINGREYPLEYHFSPGEGEDGISVLIPLPYLNQVQPNPFEWLVPGLLEDKLVALLKRLPKVFRRELVPLPQTVALCLDSGWQPDQPLCATLGLILSQKKGVTIPPHAWRHEELPNHLRMNFKIVDEGGETLLDQGRDLLALQQKMGGVAKNQFQNLPKGAFEKKNRVRWDFGPLPQRLDLTVGDRTINGFPAIQDDGSSVSLRLIDDPVLAEQIMRRGLVRLFALQLPQQVKQLKHSLKITQPIALAYSELGKKERLIADMIDLAVERVFLSKGVEEIRDAEGFKDRLQAGRGKLIREADEIAALSGQILLAFHGVRLMMKSHKQSGVLKEVTQEVQGQLDRLIPADFLWQTPKAWLRHTPRFLKAIQLRLERRIQDPKKDNQKAQELAPLWKSYLETAKKQAKEGIEDAELTHYYWMLEEFRVSLFAQELKTSIPISSKRLLKQWQKVLK
ncbi:MAG: ATP-dependent RNA helicase HrpA [Magnetococcales bacterium]|nr:ATP-dependent RNA helicase HrpA [Magnetococcales bacterium]